MPALRGQASRYGETGSMMFWVDAQLPPTIATWLSERFGVGACSMRYLGLHAAKDMDIFQRARAAHDVVLISKDGDFVGLIDQHGAPPRLIWVTCGNVTNRRLRQVFEQLFEDALAHLEAGESVVEIGDAP